MTTTRTLRAVACLALLTCGITATPAAAQRLRGAVVLPDSMTPAKGLIVVASDAKGVAVTSTLTGQRGEFELQLPRAGRYDLRVLRIGYRPTLVPGVDVDAGEPRSIRIVSRGEAVVLTAVRVRGDNVCRIRQDSGQLVARLWEEARKAITATQLAAPGPPLVAQWITYDRMTDLTGGVVLAERVVPNAGATNRPFASLPPDSLARVGYVRTEGQEVVYVGPDADVLLSDSFAELHCFRVEPAPREHPTWIGIAFRPARDRRGVNDIEGTLWLERQSAELRLIEYLYTGVPREYAAAKVGGAVEFLRLASGQWLVSRWAIRMPRATEHVTDNFPAGQNAPVRTRRLDVEGLQIAGGEVREVSRDNALLFSTGNSTGADLLAPLTENIGLGGTCGGSSAKDLALLMGSVSEHAGDVVAGATVSVNWNRDYFNVGRIGYTFLREERQATTSGLGWWFICDLPRATLLGARASVGTRSSEQVLVKIPAADSVARVDLRLPKR